MSKAENATFVVTTNMARDDNAHQISAAYFSHEDRFTVFKGADGAVLASFANDHVVAIERKQPTNA